MTTGSLFIISGPSGSGKGTVVKSLASSSPDYALSVSVTTRKMRGGDREGVDYFFKTMDEFVALRDNNQLLEHALFVGNLYGTPRFYVEEQIAKGKIVLLEIEVNGALQVKQRYPECVLIFLVPPNFTELQHRLQSRGTEDIESMQARFFRAREEIMLINKYDYLVVNDKVEKAVECIQNIAFAEKLRPFRQKQIAEDFFGNSSGST
ncbi:MAG: guanylate kinase [Defluviitaleaceae bacterium]|nr:guanylate kinase [Defluviitaleaceae bacterium]MCL2835679.1 guanylate kinase [Defluviitaleaceae bacterium]